MSSPCYTWLRNAALAGCAALLIAGHAVAAPPDSIQVGALTRTLCNTDYTGYCGSICTE